MCLPERIVPMIVVLLVACSNSEPVGALDAGTIDAQVVVMDPDSVQMPDAMQSADAASTLSVPDGTSLDELTTDEANALCTWMVDIQGGPHTIDCDDGTRLTIDPAADCLQNVWPHCEVGLLRTCVEAQAMDQCAPAPAACTAFYQCAGGG